MLSQKNIPSIKIVKSQEKFDENTERDPNKT